MVPQAVTTHRLRTRVSPTRPTFSAKAVSGKEFRNPASTADRASVASPRARSLGESFLPAISETASMSAVDSVRVTSMTMHIEMIAAASNFGWPNRKNPLKPTHLAECTLEKSRPPDGPAAVLRRRAARLRVRWSVTSQLQVGYQPAARSAAAPIFFRIVKFYFRITDKLTPSPSPARPAWSRSTGPGCSSRTSAPPISCRTCSSTGPPPQPSARDPERAYRVPRTPRLYFPKALAGGHARSLD